MGIVGAIVRSAQSYPALLPIVAGFIGVTIWALRSRRWVMAGAAILSGSLTCLLYTGGAPALASHAPAPTGRSDPPADHAGGLGDPTSVARDDVPGGGRFSSTARLHPRFPRDFPLPGIFRLESNSGGSSAGTLTARFRFRGEGADAVRILRDLGEKSGWQIEQKAPHRLVFRKDGRTVEAWFSFPAHSVVLDVSDRK